MLRRAKKPLDCSSMALIILCAGGLVQNLIRVVGGLFGPEKPPFWAKGPQVDSNGCDRLSNLPKNMHFLSKLTSQNRLPTELAYATTARLRHVGEVNLHVWAAGRAVLMQKSSAKRPHKTRRMKNRSGEKNVYTHYA